MVTPNAGDGELAASLLREAGVQARIFPSLEAAARELADGAGCLILVEEALVTEELPPMRDALERLPAWCDLPLIVVASDVAALGALIAAAFPRSGYVTLLERPLNPHTFVSAVQVALRASARQREVGELVAQREDEVRLRDEFLAMLAHELRNPLAPMRNALYLLREAGIEDPLVLKSTQILTRQVDHVVRMVDDLMDVARLEHGKIALEKRRVDLNRIVESAIESCRHATQERGHRVIVNLAARPLTVEGDAVRLEQIVCNLLNNAAKFSAKPGDIRVTTAIESGSGLIAVEDEGVGFDAAATSRLFTPFLQVNPTIDRGAGGLGMGLTIVQRLAELHGGSVRASSEGRGRGARFEVRIPLDQGPAEKSAQETKPVLRGPPRRIVVVEDNPDIRETMRMLLAMWGHDVSMASDGRSGLDLIVDQRPDLALIDVGLPGLSGYDVARRARSAAPGTRLIALTGYGQPSDREKAASAGFDAHLLKPIDPETLAEVIARSGGPAAG